MTTSHDLALHRRADGRRPRRTARAAVGLTVGAVLAAACSAAPPPPPPAPAAPGGTRPVVVDRVRMADGVELTTYVHLPSGDGPFPTVLLRTPYGVPLTPIGGIDAPTSLEGTGKPDAEVGWPTVTDAGYALVIQETRGTETSQGENLLLATEGADGHATVGWIDDQPWSDGAVAVVGDSAAGVAAALTAAARPPALDALYVQNGSFSLMDDLYSPGGALRVEAVTAFAGPAAAEPTDAHLAAVGADPAVVQQLLPRLGESVGTLLGGVGDPVAAGWAGLDSTPVARIGQIVPAFDRVVGDDPALREGFDTIGDIAVPTLAVTTWHDTFTRSTWDAARDAQRRGTDFRLLAFPGGHYEIDEPSSWPTTPFLAFLDETLRRGPAAPLDRYTWQAMPGAPVERSAVWPPSGSTATTLRPGAGGTLGDAGGGTATWRSDPARPITTNAGMSLVAANGPGDDPSLAEAGRPDVVAFDSGPYPTGFRIRGDVMFEAAVATDAPSADLSVRLLAVAPDGRNQLIRSGHLRGTPTTLAAATVDLGEVAHDLPGGARLRLEIGSSDLPAWSLNPQTGASGALGAADVRPASLRLDLDRSLLRIEGRTG